MATAFERPQKQVGAVGRKIEVPYRCQALFGTAKCRLQKENSPTPVQSIMGATETFLCNFKLFSRISKNYISALPRHSWEFIRSLIMALRGRPVSRNRVPPQLSDVSSNRITHPNFHIAH